MKLHLPCRLFAALLACFSAVVSQTIAADSINISFATTNTANTEHQEIGDELEAGIVKVQGQNWNELKNNSSTAETALKLYNGTSLVDSTAKVTWSSANSYAGKNTLLTTGDAQMLNGYLDDGGNGINITLTGLDFLSYDLYIYTNTDTKETTYSAKTVNGTSYTYANGVTTEGTTDWGNTGSDTGNNVDNLETTAVLGTNALHISDLSGSVLDINSVSPNNGGRGCIAGLQIVDNTADLLWIAPTGDTVDLSTAEFTRNGTTSTLANMEVDQRYLGFSNQSVTFADGAVLKAIQASAGTVTVGTETDATMQVGILHAKSGSTIDVTGTLVSSSDVTVSGLGEVRFTTDQHLGNMTLTGNLYVGDGVEIVLDGDLHRGEGSTITGGTGASFFHSVAANTDYVHEGMTVHSDTAMLVNFLATVEEGAKIQVTDGTTLNVTSSGGTLTLTPAKGTTSATVTLGSLALSGGATNIVAGAGVTVNGERINGTDSFIDGAGEEADRKTYYGVKLVNGQDLGIEGDVHLSFNGLILNRSTLSIKNGASIEAESLMGAANEKNNSTINLDGGLLNITGTDAAGYKVGCIRLAHYNAVTTINVINGGEFRALNTDVGMGDDGHSTINIDGGEVNVKGIRPVNRSGASVIQMADGMLNIGSAGIHQDGDHAGNTATIKLTGGTLGALESWTSASDMVLDGVTINTNIYNAETKTYSGTGADIKLTGHLSADSARAANTLTGSGSLTIAHTMGNGLMRADDSTATLKLDENASWSNFTSYEGEGVTYSEGTNGFTNARLILDGGTNLTEVSRGGQSYALTTNGSKSYVGNLTDANNGTYFVNSGTAVYSAESQAGSDGTTGIILRGGVLEMQQALRTTVTDAIKLEGNAGIKIAQNTNLAASSVDKGSHTLTLTGAGTYQVTNMNQLTGVSGLNTEGWTGDVRLDNVAIVGDKFNCGNANSTVTLYGVTGHMAGTGTSSANLVLENVGDTKAALDINNGNNGTTQTFTGSISGNGNFGRSWASDSKLSYVFSGDVSGWTATGQYVMWANAGSTDVTFKGNATEINMQILDNSSRSGAVFNMTVENDKAVTVNSKITGDYAVTYTGTGTKTVTNNESNYTGGTTIESGEVTTGVANSLGRGAVTIASGATLNYTGGDHTHAYNLNGGTMNLSKSSLLTGSTVTLGSGESTITGDNAALHATITGTGNLTLADKGGNLYAYITTTAAHVGNLSLSEGNVYLGYGSYGNASIASTGNVNVTGATVELQSGSTIANTGVLNISGGTMTTNSGATLSSGEGINVRGGSLVIKSGSTISSAIHAQVESSKARSGEVYSDVAVITDKDGGALNLPGVTVTDTGMSATTETVTIDGVNVDLLGEFAISGITATNTTVTAEIGAALGAGTSLTLGSGSQLVLKGSGTDALTVNGTLAFQEGATIDLSGIDTSTLETATLTLILTQGEGSTITGWENLNISDEYNARTDAHGNLLIGAVPELSGALITSVEGYDSDNNVLTFKLDVDDGILTGAVSINYSNDIWISGTNPVKNVMGDMFYRQDGVQITLVDAGGRRFDLSQVDSLTINGYAGIGTGAVQTGDYTFGYYYAPALPEPTTATLSLLALAALAARRRRK